MKILITVDPEIPVPPTNYGGIERIVDSLISAYKQNGHQVYLAANPESKNNDTVQTFGWPALYSRGTLNVIKNAKYLYSVCKQIKPDIIHSFSRLLYLYPVFLNTKIPVLQTYQRAISTKSTQLALKVAGEKLHFTSCGEHMVHQHPIADKCTPVHNFTDTDYYSDDVTIEKEFLFFLGRIEDIKGTREAIEVALETKRKLIIAGNIQPGHDEYFNTNVKPHLNNPLIEYVGPVNDEQKLYYLQRSKAFLFPIKWEEPFGIVMAEAMACGVPVIGFRRGSVPEVVNDGITGYVVDNVEQMITAVNKIDQIDRNNVRKECEERFSLDKISKQYLSIFESMLS